MGVGRRFGGLLGMRVWLALVFALVVAATAAAVATAFLGRFDAAFDDRAGKIAVGYAVDVAINANAAEDEAAIERAAARASTELQLAVFFFDGGRLMTSSRSRSISLDLVPGHDEALAAALSGQRYVLIARDGSGTVVGLPVRDGPAQALVAYASHPELEEALGLARSKIIEAALLGVLVGGLGGILVAALIARRLRRIAASAAGIERGDFDHEVVTRFPDEVGELAVSIDRMRVNLRDTFAELASERDRLTRLLERLHEGVVTLREGAVVDFANDAARALFSTELRVGDPIPEPWPALPLRPLAERLFADDARVAHARADVGEERTIVVAGIPAAGADTVVLVFDDVTEQERRERAEREFVANAAHELRTPLQTILGAVEALKSGAKDDPAEFERFLAHIEREGMRLGRLTRSLLVLARAQTGEETVALAPVELRPLLEEIAARARPRDGVRVETTCPRGLRALVETSLLEHAVGNLAANAAQHTTTGRVTIEARRGGDGYVEIAVSDTGPGIPAEVRERVFDRFFRRGRRSSDGFGLGLAIARESVRALGGDVVIDDGERGGTRVVVTVRAADAEAA